MAFCPQMTQPLHPKEEQACHPFPTSFSPTPFAPLTEEELATPWGMELRMGLTFGADFDLYRALTCFKRALILLPPTHSRRLEVEYDIALAYYLGHKYSEALLTVNQSAGLLSVTESFPAFSDLLLILYDSYNQLGCCKEADYFAELIEKKAPALSSKLTFFRALQRADFSELYTLAESTERMGYVTHLLDTYCCQEKSIQKAALLNSLLPGAGYWYVGMHHTAFTALIVNSLFVGAAVYFIEQGNAPAAIITLSLESGWYIGGIYGGALAAKAYNESLYDAMAQKIGCQSKLFPLLRLQYAF